MSTPKVRFSGKNLPPWKKKHRSQDGFEFRPDVILPLSRQKRWRNAEIVILGIEFHRHLQSLLSIIEVSRGRCTQTFKCGAVGVGCLSGRRSTKVAEFDFPRR